MSENEGPKTNPGEIIGWPFLRIDYPTDPEGIAALLPPGIEPGAEPNVELSIYCFPVPDEPEFGVVLSVDAEYRGTAGKYAVGYGIDQESAVIISREMNGQPKYQAEIDYFRMGPRVVARCSHQGYTFLEFEGQSQGAIAPPEPETEHEWWVKVSRAVGGAEKAYDFPPHVVHVATDYKTIHHEKVEGKLTLRESPWDPIATQLPVRGEISARLWTAMPTSREITLEGALDPDAFWPYADTISGSRWLGQNGGPRREP